MKSSHWRLKKINKQQVLSIFSFQIYTVNLVQTKMLVNCFFTKHEQTLFFIIPSVVQKELHSVCIAVLYVIKTQFQEEGSCTQILLNSSSIVMANLGMCRFWCSQRFYTQSSMNTKGGMELLFLSYSQSELTHETVQLIFQLGVAVCVFCH